MFVKKMHKNGYKRRKFRKLFTVKRFEIYLKMEVNMKNTLLFSMLVIHSFLIAASHFDLTDYEKVRMLLLDVNYNSYTEKIIFSIPKILLDSPKIQVHLYHLKAYDFY